MSNRVLVHYGVQGMKWGVRNGRRSSGATRISRTRRGKARARKNLKNMSDKDLRQYLKRADMEKRYMDINKSDREKGREAVNKILANSGKVVVTGLVTTAMTKIARSVLPGL